MVGKYLNLFIVILIVSCDGMKTRTLDNKITNVPYDNSAFKNKYFFEAKCLTGIDTVAIYKEEFGYETTKNSFENIYRKKYYQSSSFRGYYKFYKNGQVSYFSFSNPDEVTIANLNPNFTGQRGVLYSKKNEIRLDLFTIVGYGYGREYGIISQIIEVKGDTIFEKSTVDLTYVNLYVKRKIPKEYLIYKPDW